MDAARVLVPVPVELAPAPAAHHTLATRRPGGSSDGARIRMDLQKSSSTIDQVLRGPADKILQDSSRAECRLCGGSLTGHILVDEQVVANGRLVCAMDIPRT